MGMNWTQIHKDFSLSVCVIILLHFGLIQHRKKISFTGVNSLTLHLPWQHTSVWLWVTWKKKLEDRSLHVPILIYTDYLRHGYWNMRFQKWQLVVFVLFCLRGGVLFFKTEVKSLLDCFSSCHLFLYKTAIVGVFCQIFVGVHDLKKLATMQRRRLSFDVSSTWL